MQVLWRTPNGDCPFWCDPSPVPCAQKDNGIKFIAGCCCGLINRMCKKQKEVRSCLDNAWRQATKNPDAPTLQGETFREHEPSSSWENKVQIIISIICFVRRAWIFDDESIELRSRLLLVVWFLVASAHLWNRPTLLQLVVVVFPFWVCLFWLLDRGYMPLLKIIWKKKKSLVCPSFGELWTRINDTQCVSLFLNWVSILWGAR